jgi:hypothetical protein
MTHLPAEVSLLGAKWLQPYQAAIFQYVKDSPGSSNSIDVTAASISLILVKLSRVDID